MTTRRNPWIAIPMALALGGLAAGCISLSPNDPDGIDDPSKIGDPSSEVQADPNLEPSKDPSDPPLDPTDPTDPSDPADPQDPSDPITDPEDPSDPQDPIDETLPGAIEDLILTSDGRFLLSLVQADAGRCLSVTDLDTRTVALREDLCGLQAVRAAAPGQALLLRGDGRTVLRLTLPAGDAETVHVSEATSRSLVVSPDGAHIALLNLPQRPSDVVVWETDPTALWARRVELVDLASGASQAFVAAAATRDLDMTNDSMIVTSSKWDKFGVPWTTVQTWKLADMSYTGAVEFPNCADDLKLQPEGPLAVLAPRTCVLHDVVLAQPEIVEDVQEWEDFPPGDPVSVINLETGEHLGNVPGFGPVEWSPDGSRVAGFTVQETLMVEWNTFQNDPFGVIVVDVSDLTWDAISVGDVRPQYAFSTDGAALLVHSAKGGAPMTAGVATGGKALASLEGPAIALRERVSAPDGSIIASAGGALYRISADSAAVSALNPGVSGDRLLARPQGDWILWADRAGGALHILRADDLALDQTLALPGPVTLP